MNKKFANAGADQFLSGATVVLLQCIIGAFTHGPLTERDLRIRVDTQCQALGISTSSKGTPAGTLVEINSACNVLMQLGILELVAPSEATAVLAETDSDAQSDTKSSSVAAVAADALVSKLQDSWNEYIDRYRAAASAAGAPPTEGMRRFNFDFSMDVAADDDDLPKLERSGASDTGSTTLANSANETTMDDADDGGNETQLIKLERCSSKATDDGDDCTAEVSLVRSRGRPPSSSSRKKAKQKTKRNVGALRIWKLRDDLCTLSKDAVAPCESTMQQDNSFSSNPAAWLQVLSEKHYQMNAALELEERIMRRLAGQCEFPMAYANHRTGTSYLVSGAACRTASAGSAYADDTATANGAAYPGVGGNANCMDVYNTEKRITADYLLDKVKASRRQRGACLVKQHNQLITSYLNDLAAKEDTYLAKSYDLNQPRMVGIYDESYIDAARGVCKRNASSVWREGNDASRKGKDRVTMADFSRELIRECRQSSSGSNAAIQGALLTAAQLHDLDLMNGRNRTFDASQEVNILSIRRYGVPLELEDAHTAAPTQSFRVITDGDADSIEGANRNAVYALPDMKIVTSEIPWQEVAGEFYYLIPSTEADAAPAAEVKSSSSSSTTTTTGPLSSDALKRPESRNSLTSRASGSARRRSSSQLSECPAAPPLAMKRSTSQASTCSEERIGNAVDQPMKKVRLYVSRPVNDVRASAIVDEKRLSPRESSAVSHQESSGSSSSSSNPIDVVAPNFQLITSATEKIKLQVRATVAVNHAPCTFLFVSYIVLFCLVS